MKTAMISAGILLLVSVVGHAQTPNPTPLTPEALATILGAPATCGASAVKPSTALFVANRPRIGLEKSLCSATANCATGTVSCQGNNSTTSCSGFDRNCSLGERGHVTCDGITTSCPTACTVSDCTGIQKFCCLCAEMDDCYNCCRCSGGGPGQCAARC
jgi:hypothetical protein